MSKKREPDPLSPEQKLELVAAVLRSGDSTITCAQLALEDRCLNNAAFHVRSDVIYLFLRTPTWQREKLTEVLRNLIDGVRRCIGDCETEEEALAAQRAAARLEVIATHAEVIATQD